MDINTTPNTPTAATSDIIDTTEIGGMTLGEKIALGLVVTVVMGGLTYAVYKTVSAADEQRAALKKFGQLADSLGVVQIAESQAALNDLNAATSEIAKAKAEAVKARDGGLKTLATAMSDFSEAYANATATSA